MHVIPKQMLDNGIHDVNPITLSLVIYIINGLFFTTISKKSTPISNISKKNWVFLVLIGIAEVLGLITYFFGLKNSSAANAAVLNSSEIIFSIFIAIIILRESLKRKEIGPFTLIILGVIVVPIGYDMYNTGVMFSNMVTGDFLILLSGVFFAADINISKYVTDKIDSKRITQITSFVSGLVALVMMFTFNIPFDITVAHLPGILLSGLLGTGIATFCFVLSLKFIGSVRTTLLYSTGTAFGVIFSWAILGESISFINIFTVIMIFTGIFFLRKRISD
ncbi:MAG: DMT family transporter [Nitrosarchaeum sp.]|nr:DMT family transporter [Nitrosarchaeum sp.]